MNFDEIIKLHDHIHAVKRLTPVLPSRDAAGVRPSGFNMQRLAQFFDDIEVSSGIKHELAIGISAAIESAIEREIGKLEAAIERLAGEPWPPAIE